MIAGCDQALDLRQLLLRREGHSARGDDLRQLRQAHPGLVHSDPTVSRGSGFGLAPSSAARAIRANTAGPLLPTCDPRPTPSTGTPSGPLTVPAVGVPATLSGMSPIFRWPGIYGVLAVAAYVGAGFASTPLQPVLLILATLLLALLVVGLFIRNAALRKQLRKR